MRNSFLAEEIWFMYIDFTIVLSFGLWVESPLGQSRFHVAGEDYHGGGSEIPDDGSCFAMTERDCASPTPSSAYPDNQVGLYDTPESLVQ